jgi:hypothetical protein
MRWHVIDCREFYDVPRMIVAANEEGTFLFYSRFDEVIDDYASHYEVYRMPELDREVLAASWEGLERRALERRPNMPVSALPFTVKRRGNASAA